MAFREMAVVGAQLAGRQCVPWSVYDKTLDQAKKPTSERLLNLRHVTSMQLRREHWLALGEATGCADLIEPYDALGVVHWGDHGYDACVLHVLTGIVERHPEHLETLEAYVDAVCCGADEGGLANATLTRL